MLSVTDILLLLLSMLTIATYFYLTRNFNYWKSKNVSYEKPMVLFGNIKTTILGKEPMGQYLANLYKKFDGPYYGIYVTDRPALVLKDPNIIKRILVKDFRCFQNRIFACDENIDPMTTYSLLGITAPRWRDLRSKLSPIFTSGKIKKMLHLLKECADNFETYVTNNLDKNVDAKKLASEYTTDVIASCAFGITTNCFIKNDKQFRTAVKEIFVPSFIGNLKAYSFFVAPLFVNLFKFSFIPRETVNILRGIFMSTVKQRQEMKTKRNDMVDFLVDLKNQETHDDTFKFDGDKLLAQAVVFLGAGYDTTSSTISFTLHELCLNTEIQNRLRKEIIETIKNYGGITYEALQEMKYLDMVVAETLRKYPLTPFLQRICLEDFEIPETGLALEKGLHIFIPQQGLHWDPKYFPNPEKYDPERFNNENKCNINPYVYLPFGEGPRNCLGERFGWVMIKLGIARVISNFKVERNANTKESLQFTAARLLQVKGGLPMTFRQL